MPDFKDLHKKWKKAKDDAKRVYDGWSKVNMDISDAPRDVKFNVPPWPKFNLDLGPSLEKLEKSKDVEKSKVKAEKAVKQYKKDIKAIYEPAKDFPKGDDKKKELIRKAVEKYLEALEKVRLEIEKALDE